MTRLAVLTTAKELALVLNQWRTAGETIAFVPTMGSLHEGHKKLVATAATKADRVVVSVYVNPLQFGEGEDFDTYPRNLRADADALSDAGADVLWAPQESDIYPEGAQAVPHLSAGKVGEHFEGEARPGHFDGVLTVVSRLLTLVAPDYLVMGEKDAQQLWLVQDMVTREGFDTTVLPVATLRDTDGVALSSRNAYLSPSERHSARALSQALRAAAATDGGDAALAAAREILDQESGVRVDYLSIVDPETFEEQEPHTTLKDGVMIVAAIVGGTRLIDNTRLTFGQ